MATAIRTRTRHAQRMRIASEPAGDLHADRHVRAVRDRPRPREGAVSAPRGGRSGDPSDAGRAGAPARGRRPRLHHRHRRRGVRARVVRRGRNRCSPLNVGGGMVQSAHGLFPVPAPATVKLLGGRAHLQRRRSEGAGDADRRADRVVLRDVVRPAARDDRRAGRLRRRRQRLRVDTRTCCACSSAVRRPTSRPAAERVVVIECEIDDMNPQMFGVAMDRLYAAGALEVFYVAAQMKKNRPGTLLTVVAPPDRRERAVRRSSSGKPRRSACDTRRSIASACSARSSAWRRPSDRYGSSSRGADGRLVNAVPEFEDCAALAAAKNLSVKEVQALAVKAFDRGSTSPPGGRVS